MREGLKEDREPKAVILRRDCKRRGSSKINSHGHQKQERKGIQARLHKEWGSPGDLSGTARDFAWVHFGGRADVGRTEKKRRVAIVLACASKAYLGPYLEKTGAEPLLWTTGLMAPEAYTLKAALDGWIAHEDGEAIRKRAAGAYDKYQKCGLRGAQRLFASGW
jgi:hypothetical protein